MLESPPPRREIEPDPLPLALRAATLGIIFACLLGFLLVRLWALQILHADQYAQAATQSIRHSVLPAERGTIVDSTGKVMVGSSAAISVQINPGQLPQPADCSGIAQDHSKLKREPGCAVLWRLSNVLQMPFAGPNGIVHQYFHGQTMNEGYPTVLSVKVTKPEVEYVKERMTHYKGVEFLASYQRHYMPAALDSQNILGWVGPITKQNLDSRFYKHAGLPKTGTAGQNGLELTYDKWLRGTDGSVAQTFDAAGTPLGRSYLQTPAMQGSTLKLTVDSKLQQVATRAIRHGISVAQSDGQYYADAGAIVAMNPKTGAIVAQATWPGYDPSIWVSPYKGQKGVLAAADRANKDRSLPSPLNDLTSGLFPAGSTFKPFTAAAAWKAGLLGPGTSLDCSTSFTAPLSHDLSQQVFNNWGPGVGTITLPTALTISCDTFFYRLGDGFYGRYLDHGNWRDFQDTLDQFGFGRVPTGYDLLTAAGTVPSPAWKRHYVCFQPGPKKNGYVNSCGYKLTPKDARVNQIWDPGDDIQLAIGQSYLQVTPLQEAVAYAAIANGGKIVRPHVVSEILDPANNNAVLRRTNTSPVRNLHLSPEFLQEVYDGLHGATHDSQGTSSAIFGSYTGQPFDVWGKTGTAETGLGKPNDAWWSGWASNGKKSLVVVAMIRNGGHGGVSAAPAALQVFQSYFGQKVTNVAPSASADVSR